MARRCSCRAPGGIRIVVISAVVEDGGEVGGEGVAESLPHDGRKSRILAAPD
jgi:hypothetical protein